MLFSADVQQNGTLSLPHLLVPSRSVGNFDTLGKLTEVSTSSRCK